MNYVKTFWIKLFWVGLLSVLLFFIAGYINAVKPNLDSKAQKFQNKFIEYENDLEQYLINIVDEIENTKQYQLAEFVTCEKYPIVIFKNDSLIYWTSNTIPINQSINENLENKLLFVQNAWHYCITKKNSEYKVIGFIPIYFQYPYQNKYLQNGFSSLFEEFDKFFSIDSDYQYDSYSIANQQQDYLFTLNKIQNSKNNIIPFWFLFVLFIIFCISFVTAIQRVIARKIKCEWISYIILFALLFVFRVLQIKYFFPSLVYEHSFFSPIHFAYSQWLGSIGDYLFDLICLLWCVILLYYRYSKSVCNIQLKSHFFYMPLLVIVQLILFIGAISLVKILVINSSLTLNFIEIAKMNFIDAMGFLIILLISMILLLSNYLILHYYRQILNNKKFKYFLLSFLIIVIIISIFIFPDNTIYVIIFYSSIVVHFFIKSNKFNVSGVYGILTLAVLGIIFGSLLHQNNILKEQNYRNLYAMQLASEQDPIAEYLIQDISTRISKDTKLTELIDNDEQILEKYLKDNYFSGYFSSFHSQITICKSQQYLLILPSQTEVLCADYFNNLIKDYGNITQTDDLYLLDEIGGRPSYLYTTRIIDVNELQSDTVFIFVELVSNPKIAGLGYPELLVDEKLQDKFAQYEYSYAKYSQQKLMMQYGSYSYPHVLSEEFLSQKKSFFNLNNYSHLLHNSGKDSIVIVSLSQQALFEKIANYSYLFIIFILALYLFVLINNLVTKGDFFKLASLSSRLQATSIFIVILCFISAGLISVNFFIKYHNNKNKETLREKAYSIMLEFEHEISSFQNIDEIAPNYLSELCIKFSNVFFTEMNLFSPEGYLLASSRPQIFQQGLISHLMSQDALQKLKKSNEFFFVKDESIGELNYISAYLTFKNIDNEVIAYLNLPFFSRENELKNEISGFLVMFINIYVFLIALAVALALIIAKHITRPLKIISNKLKVLKPGFQNEKIIWTKNDELGQLVNEYNRMIDELEFSTNQLMKAERELAWEEMAKQIAHEIKNPLTPMKLNLQNLIKAWEDKAPDYEMRLKRTSDILIEQIDALSNIASQFSNFALLQESKRYDLDIVPIIQDTIHLYSSEKININFNYSEYFEYKIHANETQIIQIFNNLIKNAVQAIPANCDGRIDIRLKIVENHIEVEVEDNGQGILNENKLNIFSPNFTSKTGGTGLGLAITKNIVESIGGTISFHSEYGKGSVFKVKLPILRK